MEYKGELFEKKSSYCSKTNWSCIQTIMGKVIVSGMHPIGQILNFDNWREFQNRGNEHMHSPIHKVGAPKNYGNQDSEEVEFIYKYITCALPDKICWNEQLSKQSADAPSTTCRKKKGVASRFNALWATSDIE